MNDFLTRVVRRHRGELPTVRPRVAPLFAPRVEPAVDPWSEEVDVARAGDHSGAGPDEQGDAGAPGDTDK